MSDTKTQDRGAKIGLSRPSGGRLELKKNVDGGIVRQSFSHGRSKQVAVEVKRRRTGGRGAEEAGAETGPAPDAPQSRNQTSALSQAPLRNQTPARSQGGATQSARVQPRSGAAVRSESGGRSGDRNQRQHVVLKPLTDEEKSVRLKALSEARKVEGEARKRAEENARRAAEEGARRREEEEAARLRKEEEDARRKAEDGARRRAEEQAARLLAEEERRRREEDEKRVALESAAAKIDEAQSRQTEGLPEVAGEPGSALAKPRGARTAREEEEEEARRGRGKPDRRGAGAKRNERRGRLTVTGDDDDDVRAPSLAAMRRRQERERRQNQGSNEPQVREVVLPETISVQELAARMAIRGAEVVKVLMKNGIMTTINQNIDADTAELVVGEFGHRVKRVSEADVEEGVEGITDDAEALQSRAPVVTVMGHVDHGKTSLLDALRASDVVAGEAGGITQHIGAYQVDVGHGVPVTFIDTPGHEAFTQMRARGASVTDLVILVVAADDGVMPQTVEAIRHAQAAKVPIIVAINKIDRPEANPERVKNELLQYELIVEDFGGDAQCIEVSATQKTGLDKLIDAIQLQAEFLDLKANPDREAQGSVIEARLDRGRGVVATVLIKRGTLRVGDTIVAGAQWGRVRALVDDHGSPVEAAGPSKPVEVLGLDGVPEAGDKVSVVDNERRARDITDYRQRKRRGVAQVVTGEGAAKTSLEEMFSQLQRGEVSELPLVVKSDVHGSLEAIAAGLEKLGTDEVSVRMLHGGVGGITESDVTLAQASSGIILGFNVRANAQARELAKREGVEIRYYSIIYELLDEMKGIMSGMLAPEAREEILGHAEIREVFSITKVGKVAGCRVLDGTIRRQSRARLLRDDVVIYEGALGSLKRFKEDVREVKEGFECGMAFESYNDIRQGDVIEAYDMQEVARSL